MSCHWSLSIPPSKATKRTEALLKNGNKDFFKKILNLSERHVFMWQSLEILNVFNTFNTLTNKLSGKQKIFSKNWSTVFKLKVLRVKMHNFH